jgi:molecular chaperone DnaK (HSP70)
MALKLAIDFGTTNSVIARWNDDANAPEVVSLPGISRAATDELPVGVPSLIYIHDGTDGRATIGQAVRDHDLDVQKDNRLFRNFKRGIVAAPAPDPRKIDGIDWADRDAGRVFVRQVIDQLPYKITDLDELVLTAPVASFEGYLSWLNDAISEMPPEKVRIVDESTAAALGYMVTKPGAVVLVFDFGGGTLDLSLVELPESREKTGGFLQRLRRTNTNQHIARVIAKAGRIIGGSDIDQWIIADVLKRAGVSNKELGTEYSRLLTRCEHAKIALSTQDSAEIAFEAGHKAQVITLTREELEKLLEENGFSTAIRRVVDKVMHVARQKGIFKEDIHYVLMVGGTSLMPSVQSTLKQYFSDMAVKSDKPFTAVAEGALQVAAGYGLDDYLVHSYGLRHLDETSGEHHYDEIIPMGSRFPSETPVELVLSPAHGNQKSIEFVIGEIDTDSVSMIEVKYENGQAVFVAQAGSSGQQIMPLNEAEAMSALAELDPAGETGKDRLKAEFIIDEGRKLRVSVTDLMTNKKLLENVPLVTVR